MTWSLSLHIALAIEPSVRSLNTQSFSLCLFLPSGLQAAYPSVYSVFLPPLRRGRFPLVIWVLLKWQLCTEVLLSYQQSLVLHPILFPASALSLFVIINLFHLFIVCFPIKVLWGQGPCLISFHYFEWLWDIVFWLS